MTFKYTDETIARIDKYLIERYSRLKSVLPMDELNVLTSVNSLYQEIQVYVKRAYLALANRVYADSSRTENSRRLDEQWLDEMMDEYDPVSKYVFRHEFDRKRARLIESIIASTTKTKEIDIALRAMSFMLRIYADRVTDEAVMRAYRDDGEEYVRWVAEKDEKTCSVCKRRDGHIYEIHSVPCDPHPNCRCKRMRLGG